jgi:hypothetical protein
MSHSSLPQFANLATMDHMEDALPGQWAGTLRTWFEPGVLAAEAPITGSFHALPGTHTLLYAYESSHAGRPFQGMALFSYNTLTAKMEAAWSDGFHMSSNMMLSAGEMAEGGFSVLGSYAGPPGSPPWGWRTVLRLYGADRLVVAAYNIPPGGPEAKALEAEYTRIK